MTPSLRRAEEAVVEAGMAASLIFNNYEDPKRQDKLLMAMVNLGSKCEVLNALRASQAGEPPVCVCGCHAMEHQNDPQDSHCRKCYKCDDFTPAPTPPAEEADGICDSFGHRQSCRVYRGGTCDAPPAEEAKPEPAYRICDVHGVVEYKSGGYRIDEPCPSCAPSTEPKETK